MIEDGAVAGARAWIRTQRALGKRVALVPTMGALHAGHQALMRFARTRADVVVASVFVNPTQFAPGEDFTRYPRDLAADRALAAEAGVDLLFVPSEAEIYPVGQQAAVEVGPLGTVLEGAFRPTFFRGVATVVTKLFCGLAPDVAVFGQKDAQQVVIIRQLVADLLLPVEIVCMETVRASDGLALSSRNAYLSAQERQVAPLLARSLAAGVDALAAGVRDPLMVEAAITAILATEPRLRTDYARVVSARDLAPATPIAGLTLLLVAARLGRARLIDNRCVLVDSAGVHPALP